MSKVYYVKHGGFVDGVPVILVGEDNRPYLVRRNGDIEGLNNHRIMHSKGYGKYNYCTVFGRPYHRVVALAYGLLNDIDDNIEINHINNDKTDNSIENLRAITHKGSIVFREANRNIKFIFVVAIDRASGKCHYLLDNYKTSKAVVMDLNDHGIMIDQPQFCRAELCNTADGKWYKHFKNENYEIKAFFFRNPLNK